jgi:5-methyltetrahydrofolate--homocysteine methyltransferase
VAAAKLAREVAQQFFTKDKPRFIAGSIGPTTKLPSLGHISFDVMEAAYQEQALALIDGRSGRLADGDCAGLAPG